MPVHRLSKSELAERDLKILKMLDIGCLQEDIARRYDIPRKTINDARRRCGEKGLYAQDWSGNSRDFGRAGYVDGVSG